MALRSLRLATCLVALGALGAAVTAVAGDRPATKIERTPDFLRRVDAAIDRGAAWLAKAQRGDGSFEDFPNYPGATTALAYQTLRVCGASADDGTARRAWDAMRRAYRRADLQTYSAALTLVAIAESGARTAGAAGTATVRVSAEAKRWAEEIARPLVAAQHPDGCWGYGLPGAGGPLSGVQPGGTTDVDHSNTQYALLGLDAAARCGVVVDPQVWVRSLRHFVAAQEARGNAVARDGDVPPDGEAPGRTHARVFDHARGWDYSGDADGAYASMTAGAVASLVLCRSRLAGTPHLTPDLAETSNRAAWDGLAWLGGRWPGPPQPEGLPPSMRDRLAASLAEKADGYEYYAVERAGVLAGVERMAGRDWYGEGAEVLLRAQTADGSWFRDRAGGMGPPGQAAPPPETDGALRVVDTCFALLFLKRGTPPVPRGGVEATTPDGDSVDVAAGARLTGREFEDLVDAVLGRWTRSRDLAEKARLFDAATALGPRIVPPLLARLGHDDEARRAAAAALLRRATGLDFEFDPAAPPDARAAAAARWQAWWDAKGHRVAYDPETECLVVR